MIYSALHRQNLHEIFYCVTGFSFTGLLLKKVQYYNEETIHTGVMRLVLYGQYYNYMTCISVLTNGPYMKE